MKRHDLFLPFSFLLLTLACFNTIAQSPCENFLKPEMFDESMNIVNIESSVYEYLTTYSFSSIQDMRNYSQSIGITIPIEGIPIPIDMESKSEIDKVREYQNMLKHINKKEFKKYISINKHTFSDNLRKSYEACIGTPGLKLYLIQTTDNNSFKLCAEYRAYSNEEITITKFKISDNATIEENNSLEVGSKLSNRDKKEVLITRTGTNGINISIEADKNYYWLTEQYIKPIITEPYEKSISEGNVVFTNNGIMSIYCVDVQQHDKGTQYARVKINGNTFDLTDDSDPFQVDNYRFEIININHETKSIHLKIIPVIFEKKCVPVFYNLVEGNTLHNDKINLEIIDVSGSHRKARLTLNGKVNDVVPNSVLEQNGIKIVVTGLYTDESKKIDLAIFY